MATVYKSRPPEQGARTLAFVRLTTDNPDLLVGVALGRGITRQAPSEALHRMIDALVEERDEAFPPEETRKAVRDLLRTRGFKPTGRNKPASEYLARAATDGRFPRISNVVDACNYYSLLTGFPISLLDLDRAGGDETALEIREGAEAESYVFNPAGQAIDLTGLLCVARVGAEPLGNAVKDSMATKTTEDTQNVLAVLWATRRLVTEEDVRRMADDLAGLLAEHAGATSTRAWTPAR